MAQQKKIVVSGATGRVGRLVLTYLHRHFPDALYGALVRPGHELACQDIGVDIGVGPIDISYQEDPLPLIATADLLIDFSSPAFCLQMAALCAQAKTAFISGTTGLQEEDFAALERVACHTPVLWAANMSLGIALLEDLTHQAAVRLGTDFDVEIVDFHHNRKKDAPSGTALALGEAASQGRQHDHRKFLERSGSRPDTGIGYAVLRGGSIIGEHDVIFAGQEEMITLSHRALDRMIFAAGAVKAGFWLMEQKPKLYQLSDFLNRNEGKAPSPYAITAD